jgi:hypothetical protein
LNTPLSIGVFIDSCKASVKVFLLHSGNEFHCLTGSCSTHERNVREPSGFAAKKYAMKNIGGYSKNLLLFM